MSRKRPPPPPPGDATPPENVLGLDGTKSNANPANVTPSRVKRSDKQLAIEDRRRQVAIFRRHRLSIRQIAVALQKAGNVNPNSGKPWDVSTIHKDLELLTEQARAEAVRDIAEHKAEILADYQELLRLAWQERRYDDAQSLLGDIRKLLGVDSPTVVIYQEVQARMLEGIQRLEMVFADDPVTLERAIRALTGEELPTITVEAGPARRSLPPAN